MQFEENMLYVSKNHKLVKNVKHGLCNDAHPLLIMKLSD